MFFSNYFLKITGAIAVSMLLLTVAVLPVDATGKKEKKNNSKSARDYNIFPDEYSELDEIPIAKSTKDEVTLKTLEKSRQKYLQALIYIERKDTVTAAKYFEDAINILNTLATNPGIEQNDDFTDLAQSIIEDYESYIRSIDNLPENSSMFILRDKLFQTVEAQKNEKSGIKPLTILKDTLTKKSFTDSKKQEEKFTIPLVDNEFVQKNINFLTNGKPRKFFQKWLERSSKWFPMLKRIAKEEGMPEEIIYLAMIESGLSPTAVSRAKAVGMWQFIRETGAMYGLNENPSVWLDERRNPEKATRAAMRHLKDLYNDLGDWHLAMAAYNCGINGVKRSMMKCKNVEKPNFWDLRPYLPKETRNYVPLYIAAAKITMNQEDYGFKLSDLQYQPEYTYETYNIKEPVALSALAKCVGIPLEDFMAINPELICSCTPPDVKEYPLRLPVGTTQTFVVRYATLTPEEKQPWINHIIEKGETLESIAEQYSVSAKQIISANNLPSFKTRLKKGTIIRIPIDQKDLAQKNAKSNSEDADDNDNSQVSQSKERSIPELSKKNDYITHVVSNGETLYSIAQRYGVRLSDLRNLNDIPYDKEDIETGKRLKIALNATPDVNREPAVKKLRTALIIKHKVRQGETLAQIADDYSVSIDVIKKLNRIEGNIHSGQILKIQTLSTPKEKQIRKIEPEPQARQYASAIQKKATHKVRRGENIGTISAKYGVTESQLKKWNPKAISGHKVLAGTTLKIYQDQPSKGSSVASGKKINKLPKYYTVRKNDNLGEIADKFGVTVKSLKKKNGNITDKNLKKGQKIRIQ